MSKVTKNERISTLERQVAALITLVKMKGYNESEPQLKQLDQSIFDGLDEKWRFAAIDKNGTACKFTNMPNPQEKYEQFMFDDTVSGNEHEVIAKGYDASNWQNSLIERDTAKELLEVDLSSELTGSELCKAMLERGDKIVTCAVKNYEDELDSYDAIIAVSSNGKYYESTSNLWSFAVPINNQGKPLTAAEAGL